TGDLAVVGAGAATTVINAAAVSDRIFDLPQGGFTRDRVVSLQGLTVTGGRVVKVADNLGDYGGALRIDFFNDVTVTNCLFSNNSTVSGNQAGSEGSGQGGAIDNNGNSDLTITNSTFSGNSATFGGAVNNFDTLKVFSSTIAGNSAFFGGGLSSSGTSTTLKN